ncbi:glutathione S-transferase family protein [Methylobacterium terricola]|uniref:Glutathione S-transferase family protein n=1 Tax=Methylobacterium terricola TaxID=2583531 RepID=A0A5C4LPA7_9HYPH|nr:glutathione S-transferase family protein [Methylobacterium terricola]TNC16090.1 glutathione S-transferase family protein [Methylobacterium terricola]
MLTVWGRKTSSNVQALMWCIGELGLPYERHDAGHIYGGTDTPAFLAMNPNGTVPVLRDGGGEPLWETGALLRYLAGRYGAAPFWPTDSVVRARIDQWAEWSKINVTLGFTVPIFWQVVRTPPSRQDPTAIRHAVTKLDNLLSIAEAQLSRKTYLAGDEFTLADIQFGHVLYRYFDIPIDRQDRPALRRYYDMLSKRPAFREHVMVSYEELRARE